MRRLPSSFLPLLALLCGCGSLSRDDQQQVSFFQSNAQLYFERGSLDQAMGMVDRGLALDADDYKLRALKGAILLRRSNPPVDEDHATLDAALREFEAIYPWRAPARHDTYVLVYYALAREKEALRLTAESARAKAGAERKDGAAGGAGADEAERRAAEEAAAAAEMLHVLLDRGDQPRLCHYHLMQIAALLRDADGVIEHGNHYLEAAAREQAQRRANYDRTTVIGYEQEQKDALQTLRDEEIQVRTFLAEHLFGRKDYAGALTQVDAVLALDPTRSADHYNRGRILHLLGRNDEAKADMRTFLATTSLPPDNPKVVDAVQALAR